MYVVWSEGKPVSVLKATRSSMLAARGVKIAKANPGSIGPKPATYTYNPNVGAQKSLTPGGPTDWPSGGHPGGPGGNPSLGGGHPGGHPVPAGHPHSGPPSGVPQTVPLPTLNSQSSNSCSGVKSIDPKQVPKRHKEQQDLLPEARQRLVYGMQLSVYDLIELVFSNVAFICCCTLKA